MFLFPGYSSGIFPSRHVLLPSVIGFFLFRSCIYSFRLENIDSVSVVISYINLPLVSMNSSPEKSQTRSSGTGLVASEFTSKRIHNHETENIQSSASAPVSDSSAHLAASSSLTLLRDDLLC